MAEYLLPTAEVRATLLQLPFCLYDSLLRSSSKLGQVKAISIDHGMFSQDALDEIARQRPRDLYKPLRVHFIGEDGIDAGGVKKEFFQLLVTELLCPDYGMLVFQQVFL